jgi:hypothetical protein
VWCVTVRAEEVVDGRSGKRLRRFGRDMAAVEVEEL